MLNKTDTTARPLRIGVDSGGTFTDVCVVDESTGKVLVWKVSSTPRDPSEGIANGIAQGIEEFSRASGSAVEVVYFGHGTTVATNALIQGRGAETGLLTTAGFRDLLELRRQRRPSLYDIQTVKPPLLVSRDRRLEVTERTLFDGSVAVPLDEEGVRAAVRRLRDKGVESIAVCLLFSFIAPEHEKRVKAIVTEEFPEAFLSVSHEVAPEFREYERLSTAVVNARLGPLMRNYLERLSPRLQAIGVKVEPHLTQSNGGVMSCESAQQQPVRLVLSGPAAGIMGALNTGKDAGVENLITFDMGGTSSDVSLIDRGRPQMVNDVEVHGYPLKAPMLDIHTVGAGGGSVAYVDIGGLLKVGPRSAGADPGPACYGRGNTEPTVTDANVLMQVLNPTHLLGGRMPIDRALSETAITGLASQLDLGLMETAHGIIRIVTANMAKAIRVISVERGYDPRDYTMIAFGGAGPLHAARLARELEMPRVMVPKYPGILCAIGLLVADLRSNFAITRMSKLEPGAAAGIESGFEGVEQRAEAWFEQEGIAPAHRRLARSLDMRYGGQGYELTVTAPEGPFTAEMMPELRRRFEQIHRQIYGYVAAEESVQVTTLRLEALGEVRKVELPRQGDATAPVGDAITGRRKVYFGEVGDFVDCPLYDREKLQPGHAFSGPALVDQMDSTTLVLPGQTVTVDAYLNLFIEG